MHLRVAAPCADIDLEFLAPGLDLAKAVVGPFIGDRAAVGPVFRIRGIDVDRAAGLRGADRGIGESRAGGRSASGKGQHGTGKQLGHGIILVSE